ncbi:zinc finger, CCHC-type containing protein [Tanacetum coccineum]
MTEEGKNRNNKQNKGKKHGFNENNGSYSSIKKPKLECWKCGKTCHFKRDCRSGKKKNANAGGSRKGSKDQSQEQDGSVLYMGDDHFAPVHGKGSVVLEFSLEKSITLFNVLYVLKLRKNLISGHVLNKCGYKQVYESDKYILSKSGVFVGFGYYNNGMFMLNLNKVPDDSGSVYMSSSTVVNSSLWHARLGHLHYKIMLEMSKHALIPAIDENPENVLLVEVQQNDLIKSLRTDRGGEYYDPAIFQYVGIIYETTAPYTPQQNGIAERKNRALKEMVNSMLSYSSLSEGFWGEAMLTACYLLNRVPNKRSKTTIYELWDDHLDDVPSEIHEPRKGKRVRKAKSYGSDFQLYLVERSRDQIESQYSYCYTIEEDPITYNEAMQSRDVAFWKEAIDDEIGSIMENNTWFKARLVIQDFRQKEGIDYFDTYAKVARITTIKLLLALATIHNLVVHQMDVKTTFLNDDLEEKVYMKQPKGFVMPVDKTKKFLSSRFCMKDMGEADVILSIKIKRENKGIVITQSHYIEKILKKFNREDCSPMSTPVDPVEKLKPNTVGRLSRFTSNPSRQYLHAITRVFKYLKGTMNYGLSYVGYPLVLEAYSDASWINHVEDSSSTSGWVFLLGRCAISWASKKQTCIIGSTIEYEFVALAVAGKEA